MILYLDTSAILKLYVAEPGSDLVCGSVRRASACYTHLIAYAEIRAGLAKALRMGRETPEDLALHKRELDEMWESFGVLAADEAMIRRAGDLAEQHGLRGYDSVHLAAIEAARSALGPQADLIFGVFDERLRTAASHLGFHLLSES